MSVTPAKVILPSLLGAMAISYVFFDLTRNRKIFGGTVPRTLTKEWEQETERLMDRWPRVAGPPVIMNPISRQNYRVVDEE